MIHFKKKRITKALISLCGCACWSEGLSNILSILFLLKKHLLTLMGFKLLLSFTSPNVPFGFAVFVIDVKQLLKVKFVVYCVMTKIVANE